MKNLLFKIIYKTLAIYARFVIKKHNPFIVAITGSVGKTSTKEAIFQVLHDQYGDEVRKSYGNMNAEIGVPLTILGYESLPNKFLWPFFLIAAYFRTKVAKYPKYLVLEMGVDKPFDMEYLTSIVKPDLAVITSVTPAHIANFNSIEDYQKEKLLIIKSVKEGGKIVVNGDDKVLSQLDEKSVLSVGITNKGASYRVEIIEKTLDGTTFRIEKTGQKIVVKSKLLGEQFAYSSAIAFAIGDLLEIQLLNVAKSLEKIEPMPGRMRIIDGKKNTVIIDDTYNSNPTSAKAALEFLSELKTSGRKVAILGNMNELGHYEKDGHKEVADIAERSCDFAVFVGPNSKIMLEAFGDKKRSTSFDSKNMLLKKLDSIINVGDIVLIKASQNNNYFEEVVKSLMSEPERASELLVRQSKWWAKKKNK